MLTLKTGKYTYNDFAYLERVLNNGKCAKICGDDCPHKTACKDVDRLIAFLDKTIAELEKDFDNETEE